MHVTRTVDLVNIDFGQRPSIPGWPYFFRRAWDVGPGTAFARYLLWQKVNSRLELSRFITPPPVADHRNAPVNALGYLRVMFAVEDIDEMVTRLRKRGAELKELWWIEVDLKTYDFG
jgi:hypothetical protein